MNETSQTPVENAGYHIRKIAIVWGILLLLSMVFLYALSFLLPTLAQLAVQRDPTMNNTGGFQAMTEGNFPRAEELFMESLQQEPNQDLPHFGLAMVRRRKGELEKALTHAEKAIAVNPQDVRFHLTKSDILADMQRYDEAVQSASDALRVSPDSDEVYLKIGRINMKAKDYALAEEAFFKALAYNPDNAQAERELALSFGAQGELENAITSWRRLVSRFPSNPEYHFFLGLKLFKKGADKEALQQLQKAKELAPDEYGQKVDFQIKKRELQKQ